MEADWEVEIGPDLPIIDASWSGYVDLRVEPSCAFQLAEAAVLPGFADVLIRLNAIPPPNDLWTAKCDVWEVTEPIDPYEFDCSPEDAAFAWACYVDLLPARDQQWGKIWDRVSNTPTNAVLWCRSVCKWLQSTPFGAGRVDLVVRKAITSPETTPSAMDIGVTVYLTACGTTSHEAHLRLSDLVKVFADGFEAQAKVE